MLMLLNAPPTLDTFAPPLLRNILTSVHHTFPFCALFAPAAQYPIISLLVLVCSIISSKWARS